MSVTDFMNWRALLKGNYRKGVDAFKQVCDDEALRAEFLKSAEALSVVFDFDPSDPDGNALGLHAVAVAEKLGDAALGVMLGLGVECTKDDALANAPKIAASHKLSNALAASTFICDVLADAGFAEGLEEGNCVAAVLAHTVVEDATWAAMAGNRTMLDAVNSGTVPLGDNDAKLADAVAERYADALEGELWDGIPRISAFAGRHPDAFESYVGKSVPIAVDGYEGVTASICAVAMDFTADGDTGFTFGLDQVVEERVFSTTSSYVYGWNYSYALGEGLRELFGKIDANVRAHAKRIVCASKIIYNNAIKDDTAEAFVFAPNEAQVGGDKTVDPYPAYDTAAKRCKSRLDGEAVEWWLRDVYTSNTAKAITIGGAIGSATSNRNGSVRGLVPHFCI